MSVRALQRQVKQADELFGRRLLRLPRLAQNRPTKRPQSTGPDRPLRPEDSAPTPHDTAKAPDSRPHIPELLSSAAGPSRIPLASAPPSPNAGPNGAIRNSRLQQYMPRLHALSLRTGTPLPSLGISFLILHELTAILPLFLFFWIFQGLGLGAVMVTWLVSVSRAKSDPNVDTSGWDWRETVAGWMEEGSKRVERVGKRYGILGYEKIDRSSIVVSAEEGAVVVQEKRGGNVAEKVASAISAYVVVKALLPVRVAASIGFAPAFARFALNPIQRLAMKFRRQR